MKQNPRGRPVSRSVGIFMSAAFLNSATLKRSSWVAFHERFLQKMVRDSRSAILRFEELDVSKNDTKMSKI